MAPYDVMKSVASPAVDPSAASASLTSNCILLSVACGVAPLFLSGLIFGVILYKYRQKNSSLQHELDMNEADLDDLRKTLTSVKTGLEEQRDLLQGQLGSVEAGREKNRRKLQDVEQKIREVTFDRREDLLREKEKLLDAQWKLDETKKNNEGQMLFIKKQLETIEIQFRKINRKTSV